ncbi:MAG: hypothetical protein ACYTGR_13545 [Planctomycetota bacterium]
MFSEALHRAVRATVVPAVALAAVSIPVLSCSDARGDDIDDVIAELNSSPTVTGTEDAKSYTLLFDAYLDVTRPPSPVGVDFNLMTIHPGMSGWSDVSSWAESNPAMADAIIAAKDRKIVGLPYGASSVPSAYRSAGVVAEIGVDGSLAARSFPYLDAVRTISAFATAETYRRLEAGEIQAGLDLAMAHLAVLRQFCDREFLVEKSTAIRLLSAALTNLRDVFYTYSGQLTAEQLTRIGRTEIPYLRPGRGKLLMPEADRVVAAALLEQVFDAATGSPITDKFSSSFAGIQSADAPFTRFGAARRWAMIAEVHSSLDASQERLTLVFDDWWRRWRIQEYDQLLDIEPQFGRTNPVRYAAVLYAIQDIQDLFKQRNRLIVEVNGTAMAAGLCAYKAVFGNYPNDSEKIYAQFVRKSSDTDPYDLTFGAMRYRQVSARTSIDTSLGRVWLEPGDALLYSRGENNADDRGSTHTAGIMSEGTLGVDGDVIVWPPLKAYGRAQGVID